MKNNTSYYFLIIIMMSGSLELFSQPSIQDWEFYAPREAIAPGHWIDTLTDYDNREVLALSGTKEGHDNGSWINRVDVSNFEFIKVSIPYRSINVEEVERSILANLIWLDADGHQIGPREFPKRLEGHIEGWQGMEQTYQKPANAVEMEVALTYRWDGEGTVYFAPPVIEEVGHLPERKVKLATIHHKPRQSTTGENLEKFGSFIEEAGAQGADIVCLPEGMTMVGTGKNYFEASEQVPGPTTEYLGKLAAKHQMYIVAGLLEKEGDIVYNTAVFLDREGKLAGKYRKVSLPREEIEGGVSPGSSFPVFHTDFGKVGIMICWDVSFPEPARQLAMQGADVILMPIWGGNFTLAKARAIENQVYLVSSTYDPDMRSGVLDLEGNLIVEATDEHPVVVAEVDLNQQKLWPWLGEFKNRIKQEMPSKDAIQY